MKRHSLDGRQSLAQHVALDLLVGEQALALAVRAPHAYHAALHALEQHRGGRLDLDLRSAGKTIVLLLSCARVLAFSYRPLADTYCARIALICPPPLP